MAPITLKCLASLIPVARDPFRLPGLVWLARAAFQGGDPSASSRGREKAALQGGAKRDEWRHEPGFYLRRFVSIRGPVLREMLLG